MVCRIAIEGCVDDMAFDTWNELTNNAKLPSFIVMDIPCIPAVGDLFSAELTYGNNIVEVEGNVKARNLTDGRKNFNLSTNWQIVYYWITLENIKVGLYDTIE